MARKNKRKGVTGDRWVHEFPPVVNDTSYGGGSKSFTSVGGFTCHIIVDDLKKAKRIDDLFAEIEGFNGGAYSVNDLTHALEVLKLARDFALQNKRKVVRVDVTKGKEALMKQWTDLPEWMRSRLQNISKKHGFDILGQTTPADVITRLEIKLDEYKHLTRQYVQLVEGTHESFKTLLEDTGQISRD